MALGVAQYWDTTSQGGGTAGAAPAEVVHAIYHT